MTGGTTSGGGDPTHSGPTTSTSTGVGGNGGGTGGMDGGVNCMSDEKICNGACVKIDDPTYGCGVASCDPCPKYGNAAATCTAGVCALGSCNVGFKNCDGNDANGCEVDTDNDPTQCGACGSPCVVPHATAACKMGMCEVGTCDTGYTDCNMDPTDGCEGKIDVDPKNCGMCGKACVGDESCKNGVCGLYCPKGKADCNNDPNDGCETPLYTNTDCAFCGDACALPNSQSSCDMMGVCNLGQCNTGWANCDMIAANGCETNTQTDANNCSGCGNICPSGPHSTPVCQAGGCKIVCDPGYADCDNNPTNGCEVQITVDANNCGMCGTVCNTPNATPACVNGSCTIAVCNTGYKDCDTQVPDGCEINTKTDPNNCGMCGTICSTPHATPGCTNGACSIANCLGGYLDCDGQVLDGCETNGNADVTNCGQCGKVCSVANGTPTCTSGQCAVGSCTSPYQDCNNSYGDGCETNTSTSPTNCGSCGHACNTPNATPACNNGTCAIGMCNAGYKDCNNTVADGCEINTNNDPNNCGGCGIKCNIANGTAACVNGMCKVGTCNSGFTDCDNNPANGCETATGSDVNNCGVCGKVCNVPNATASCTGGICTVGACNAGWTDCNNQPVDGCEVHTSVDVNNCGSCGKQCSVAHGSAGCNMGNCTVAGCATGWGDCNNSYLDGCETDTTSSNANCGMCGKNCSTTCVGNVAATACVASACTISACASGYTNNDGTCSNGCECANSTTATTCTGANNLAILSPGGTMTPFSSTLMPVMVAGVPNSAWFAITFTGNGLQTYHPKITLTDPSGEFIMDVQTDCSGTMVSTCTATGEKGNTQGVTQFETYYLGAGPPAAPNPPGDPNSKDSNGNSKFQPITVTGTLYVHVYRKNPGGATTCNQYTLNASD
jgi:hypothetical protein